MTELTANVKIAANGRLVLPKAARDAIGITGETRLIVTVDDGELKLSTASKGIERAQALYRKHVKHDFTTDDFLTSRERD